MYPSLDWIGHKDWYRREDDNHNQLWVQWSRTWNILCIYHYPVITWYKNCWSGLNIFGYQQGATQVALIHFACTSLKSSLIIHKYNRKKAHIQYHDNTRAHRPILTMTEEASGAVTKAFLGWLLSCYHRYRQMPTNPICLPPLTMTSCSL